jgi:hypothetical protein
MPTTQDPIQSFVEQLFEAAGLNNLPADFKKEYVDRTVLEVNRRIGLALVPHLDEKALKEFGILMDKKVLTPEQTMKYFETNIPDVQTKVQGAMEEFAKEFISSAEQMRNAA